MTEPRRTETEPRRTEFDPQLGQALKLGAPIAVVLLTILAGWLQGPSAAILVLAGGALLAVIAVLWASIRTLVGETPLSGADAYALGAPRAEEEQKRAVLRALKDLEFERSVGKISDEDYAVLTAKYRGEAKRLLRVLEEEAQPRRERVEPMVVRRLRKEGLIDKADAAYREAPPRVGVAPGAKPRGEGTARADERQPGMKTKGSEAPEPAVGAPGDDTPRKIESIPP